MLSQLCAREFLPGSLDKLLHPRLLLARLRAESSAGILSALSKSLAVFLHTGGRLYPGLLQLLLHAGIFSLLSYTPRSPATGVLEVDNRLFSKLAILSTRRAWRPPSNSV